MIHVEGSAKAGKNGQASSGGEAQPTHEHHAHHQPEKAPTEHHAHTGGTASAGSANAGAAGSATGNAGGAAAGTGNTPAPALTPGAENAAAGSAVHVTPGTVMGAASGGEKKPAVPGVSAGTASLGGGDKKPVAPGVSAGSAAIGGATQKPPAIPGVSVGAAAGAAGAGASGQGAGASHGATGGAAASGGSMGSGVGVSVPTGSVIAAAGGSGSAGTPAAEADGSASGAGSAHARTPQAVAKPGPEKPDNTSARPVHVDEHALKDAQDQRKPAAAGATGGKPGAATGKAEIVAAAKPGSRADQPTTQAGTSTKRNEDGAASHGAHLGSAKDMVSKAMGSVATAAAVATPSAAGKCAALARQIEAGGRLQLKVSDIADNAQVLLDGKPLEVVQRKGGTWVAKLDEKASSGNVTIKLGGQSWSCGRLEITRK